jgi:hypothetical protein
MRTLTVAAAAALASGAVPIALLVEMDLSQPLFLNSSNIDLVIAGVTYYGTKGLGKVDAASDTPAEVKALNFELSGVPSDRIALALTEPVQGKAVRIKTAIFDPSTYAVLDVHQRWSGLLDVLTISDSPGAATLQVSAEHAGIDLARPSTSLWSDAEQQRLYPGDLFLQFMNDQVEQRIVWPMADFFKR